MDSLYLYQQQGDAHNRVATTTKTLEQYAKKKPTTTQQSTKFALWILKAIYKHQVNYSLTRQQGQAVKWLRKCTGKCGVRMLELEFRVPKWPVFKNLEKVTAS